MNQEISRFRTFRSLRGRLVALTVPTVAVSSLAVFLTYGIIRGYGRDELLVALVLSALLMAVSTGSVIFAAHRAVTIPVARLLSSLRKGKESGRRVDWTSADELGTVIREYNEMLARHAAAEAEKERKSALLEATLDNLGQGVCVFDRELTLVAFNRRYLELLALTEREVGLGMGFEEILRLNASRGEYGTASINEGPGPEAMISDRVAIARSGEAHARERERPDGTILDIQTHPMPDGGFVSTYTDITQHRDYEIKMRHLTLHDVLTHLPNRALFHDRLRQSMTAASRGGQRLAVLLIDIDRFKEINDTRGHHVGDLLLRAVAERLAVLIEEGDTAASLGGDEFAILQTDLGKVDDAAQLARQVLQSLSEPFDLEERELRTTCSIGITVFPDDGKHPDEMLRNADLALYSAKAEGRHRFRYFVPEMNRAVNARNEKEEELARALEEGQLILHYQPQADLETMAVVGVEALVRWQHPERGLLSPGHFIPVAEECGLIIPLTEWVLEEACRQNAEWQRKGLMPLRVAVNLSAHHFGKDARLVSLVEEVLEKAQLESCFLELELTESAILESPDKAVETLSILDRMGVALAVDDFGTGYSSLSHLRRFPVDTLKIDRSFIGDMWENPDSAAIVKALIGLGRSLNLRIVAEGVEKESHVAFLRAAECDELQGYWLSKPLPAKEFADWLRSRDRPRVRTQTF